MGSQRGPQFNLPSLSSLFLLTPQIGLFYCRIPEEFRATIRIGVHSCGNLDLVTTEIERNDSVSREFEFSWTEELSRLRIALDLVALGLNILVVYGLKPREMAHMCIIGPDISGLQATSSYSHLCTTSPSSSSASSSPSSSSVSVTASSSACHSLVSVPPPLCNKDRNLEVSRSSSSPLLPALSSSTLLPRVSTSSSHGQSRRRNYGPKQSQRPASCKAAKLKTMEQLKVSAPLKNVLCNSSVCDSHFYQQANFWEQGFHLVVFFAQNTRELVECDETVRISYVIREIFHGYDLDCVMWEFEF